MRSINKTEKFIPRIKTNKNKSPQVINIRNEAQVTTTDPTGIERLSIY